MEWHVHDDASAAFTAQVEHRQMDEPGRLVMQEVLPLFRGDEFWQHQHRILPIVGITVNLIQSQLSSRRQIAPDWRPFPCHLDASCDATNPP